MEIIDREFYRSGKIRVEYYYNDDGEYHREGGPAVIVYYDSKDSICGKIHSEHYCIEGKNHREDGPAYISYQEDGKIRSASYYLDGELYIDKDIINNWEKFCKMQIFR